jgi:tryptophan synthase beta chain
VAAATPKRWRRRACCRRTEGIIPALESAHAVAEAVRRAPSARADLHREMSGRGDKDIDIYRENFKELDRVTPQ